MDYKKVIEDYRSGKIDKDEWELVIDNDGGYWSYIGDFENEDEYDEEQLWDARQELALEMEEKYGLPNGYQDVVDILKATGVNADWC